jgi:antigen 43
VTGPFVDDRRMLGVQVGAINLTHGRRTMVLRTEDATIGWHAAGAESGRWTHGDAELVIPGNQALPGVLEIQVLAAGPYIVEEVARIAA